MQDLLTNHDEVLQRVCRFLNIDEEVSIPQEVVFSGARPSGPSYQLCRMILKFTYLLEYWRIRKYIDFPVTSWLW